MKFKKRNRTGLKKAVNVALIIKIAVSALVLITVLGVVGSMFSGSSSGSSSGGSTVRPSRPGTSAPDTEQTEQTEQTEETTPDVPEVEKHYRVNFDFIRIPTSDSGSYYTLSNYESITDGVFVVDANGYTIDSGIQIHGWFMVDGGVSEYSAKFVDVYGDTHNLLIFPGVDTSGDAYLTFAAQLGLGADSLLGARFNGVQIPFGEGVRGLEGDLQIYATTNAGEEMLIAKVINVSVGYP